MNRITFLITLLVIMFYAPYIWLCVLYGVTGFLELFGVVVLITCIAGGALVASGKYFSNSKTKKYGEKEESH